MKATSDNKEPRLAVIILASIICSALISICGCSHRDSRRSARVAQSLPPMGEVELGVPEVNVKVEERNVSIAPDAIHESKLPILRTERLPVWPQQEFKVIENSLMTVVPKLQVLMKEADALEVWSLVPTWILEGATEGPDFRKYYASGHAIITETDEIETLLYHLTLAIANGPEEPADCFIPRHAFRIRAADRVVDVAVCFECMNGEMHEGDEYHWFTISADEEPIIDAIFDDYGLKKMK